MNRSNLVETLTGKMNNLAHREVEVIVDTIFDRMTQALAGGKRIEIRVRTARQGRNPKTGATVYVNKRKVPFFKVGKELRERVNNGGGA